MNEQVHKILIVEDDQQQLLKCMRGIPKYAPKFTLYNAPNGRIALEVVEREPPHLVVLDWDMPKMNGLETIRKLKENPKTAHIPVIMLSAFRQPDDIEVAFKEGAEDYVKKPYHELELVVRIRKALGILKRH